MTPFCDFFVLLHLRMPTLHIFNPEHDIALASNLSNFTAPHAGRQLRQDLGFLPVLWASSGDRILVDNEEFTLASAAHAIDRIEPWGWDRAIRRQLVRLRYPECLMPSVEQLDHIRSLSHRRTSSRLLPQLRVEGTVGEAFECKNTEEIRELMQAYGRMVIKAPWSSSGRGVKFSDASHLDSITNWVKGVIERQGSVMAEPLYNKVKDFGMEFSVDAMGSIHYEGLSLFHTVNGAYVGNILATEQRKRDMISHYLPLSLLDTIAHLITQTPLLDGYQGLFGIDMMVCSADENETGSGRYLLHPCVEINLRRTMGHVALALAPPTDDMVNVMSIELTDHYRMIIQPLQENKTIE